MKHRQTDPILILIYLATRVHRLLVYPLFIDEAFHIWWAREMLKLHPFGGVGEGKALIAWIIAPLYPYENALWLARIAVILAGVLGFAGLLALARKLSARREAAWLAGGFYILLPFAFFWERLAMADPLGNSLALLSGWALIAAYRQDSRWLAGLAGLLLSAAILAKLPLIALGVLPLAGWWLVGERDRDTLKLAGIMLVVLVLPLMAVIALNGIGASLGVAHAQSGFASLTLSSLPARIRSNSAEYLAWTSAYMGWPLFLLGWAGIAIASLRRDRAALLVSLLVLLPVAEFIATLIFGYPRYYLLTAGGHTLMACYALLWAFESLSGRLRGRAFQAGLRISGGLLILLITLPFLRFMGQAYRDPAGLPFAARDQEDYLYGAFSGYGLREAALWLEGFAADQPVTVICPQLITCERLSAYLHDPARVSYRRTDILTPAWVSAEWAAGRAVLLAQDNPPLGEGFDPGTEYSLSLAASYGKPAGPVTFDLYEMRAR